MNTKMIELLLTDLKGMVKTKDTEKIHSQYDLILELIAFNHEPKLLKKLTKIIKGVRFHYA